MKYLTCCLVLICLISCQKSSTSAEGDQTQAKSTPATEETKPSSVMSSGGYTLSPFSPSESFEDAEIKSYDYQEGKFNFEVAEGDYVLGAQTADAGTKMCANSAKGQHIHLIIDNKPYAAKYTSEFEYDLEDGEHMLLAFLSRSYHESIKTQKAHVAEMITVKNKSIVSRETITEPMLFYSRPKGTYVGLQNIEKVMLDFYVINAELGKDAFVRMTVNNRSKFFLEDWQPYYIEGLGVGEHSITLSLLDQNQKPISSPYLPVTREFTLRTDPTE